MWQHVPHQILVALYLAVLGAVAVYGIHRYHLVYLYVKYRHRAYKPSARYTDLPKITVQLPMFNEHTVAERIIKATCLIDYPHDKLEVQVLDDSTDGSADIARRCCEEWAAKGYPVKYVHRDNREGYKAGALAAGLKQARGEFIAIFDADFVPPREMLHNVVDYFTDPKIGMCQVRWDHLNRDASLLTKSQAIFLDGHFVIEHTARNRSGRFMHFNGTAGVWRRTCIDDAGGWHHDTLTEDLDLSYRAQMKGWQFVYLPQYAAPAELPPEMISFKQQAHRWTKGSFQTCLKLLPGILKTRALPFRIKTEAFFHLTSTVVYPLMVLMTLLMYPAFYNFWAPLKDQVWGHFIFSASLFVLATCSASTFFIFGQRELFGQVAGWKTILHLPFLMALGVGMCINNTKAVIEAVWTHVRKKPSEFVRTPKYGVTGTTQNQWRKENVFTFKRLMLPMIEILFGCYMVCCVLISLMWQFGMASVPFLLIFAGGYLYVGFASLHALWKMNQDAADVIEAPEIAST